MTTGQVSTTTDGIITGPLRRSVNGSHDAKGSIHDDATTDRKAVQAYATAPPVNATDGEVDVCGRR